jgi:hypothetical protein
MVQSLTPARIANGIDHARAIRCGQSGAPAGSFLLRVPGLES